MRPGRAYAGVYSRGFVFGDRMCLVRREKVIPEMLEIGSLPSNDQCFGRETIESEVPNPRIVVDRFPSFDARQEGVHQNKALRFPGKLCRVRVGHHQADIMSYH